MSAAAAPVHLGRGLAAAPGSTTRPGGAARARLCNTLPPSFGHLGTYQLSEPGPLTSAPPLLGNRLLETCDHTSLGVSAALTSPPLVSTLLPITIVLFVTRRRTQLGYIPSAARPSHRRSRRLCAIAEGRVGSQAVEDDQKTPFRHFDPEWPMQAGVYMDGQRAPLVFALSESEQLTAYICSDPLGPFAQKLVWPDIILSGERQSYENERDAPCAPGQWTDWGFHFSGKEQYLLKADWHSVHAWGDTFEMFVPRKGANSRCQIAPPRLLAFLEAFRDVNQDCWKAMVDGMRRMKEVRGNEFDDQRVLNMFLETFEESGHFAAIDVQAGPSLGNYNMSWHRDGVSGLLHLAITLSGSRTVKFRSPHEMHEVHMGAGNFYLSSPFLFDHGVEYHQESDDSGPLLALMCRFGFLDEKDTVWSGGVHGPVMYEVTELIATCLKEAIDTNALRLPTLQEVQRWEEQH